MKITNRNQPTTTVTPGGAIITDLTKYLPEPGRREFTEAAARAVGAAMPRKHPPKPRPQRPFSHLGNLPITPTFVAATIGEVLSKAELAEARELQTKFAAFEARLPDLSMDRARAVYEDMLRAVAQDSAASIKTLDDIRGEFLLKMRAIRNEQRALSAKAKKLYLPIAERAQKRFATFAAKLEVEEESRASEWAVPYMPSTPAILAWQGTWRLVESAGEDGCAVSPKAMFGMLVEL